MKTPTQIAMIAALAATFLAAGGKGGTTAATKPGTASVQPCDSQPNVRHDGNAEVRAPAKTPPTALLARPTNAADQTVSAM
jgi:hypothetical protein